MQKASAPSVLRSMFPYGGVVSVGIVAFGLLSAFMGYIPAFEWLNSQYFSWGDTVFPHLTHLGQGVTLAGIIAWMYAQRDPAWGLTCMLTLVVISVIVGLLKSTLFVDWYRPVGVLGDEAVHYVNLVRRHALSFPSGHSAAAAASFAFLAAPHVSNRRFWLVIAGLCTLLAGYTRVYVGVHFPADVAAGWALGLISALVCIHFVYPRLGVFSVKWAHIIRYLGIMLVIIGVAALLNTYYIDTLDAWDKSAMHVLNGWHTPFWDKVMKTLSGRLPWIWVPPALLFFAYRHSGWWGLAQMAIGIGVAILLADRISAGYFKPTFERFRPCRPEAGLDWVYVMKSCGGKYGFLSSHASNFFALATLISLFFQQKKLSLLVFFLATAVAYSRIYLGVHFPGDVIAGAMLGMLCGWLAMQISAWSIGFMRKYSIKT